MPTGRRNAWGTARFPQPKSKALSTDRLGSVSQRLQLDGRSFASKLEAATWQILRMEEKAGMIRDLRTQDNVLLTEARIRIIPDFAFFDVQLGCPAWAEAKGFRTEVWMLKKRLWKFYGPGPMRIYEGRHTNPKLTEVLVPTTILASTKLPSRDQD